MLSLPETSPGKSFFLYPITAVSTYLSTNYHFGRYKGVVAYPKQICLIYRFCSSVPDFAVSLPSVHTSRYTTLRLANASGTTPRVRDFHPLEKLHLLKALFNQKYLYFCNFSLALQQVRTAHAGRTHTPMFIGWLTCIPAVLLPHSLCRSTTANAPANRQCP